MGFSVGPEPTKPTTPSQLQVIAWGLVLLLLVIACILLYLSIGQPAEKHDLAMQVRRLGFSSLGGALLIAAITYGITRYLES